MIDAGDDSEIKCNIAKCYVVAGEYSLVTTTETKRGKKMSERTQEVLIAVLWSVSVAAVVAGLLFW